MKKLFIIIPIIIFLFASCGPSLCDCVNAEKNDSGAIKEPALRTECETMMAEKKKALTQMNKKEKEETLKSHQKNLKACME